MKQVAMTRDQERVICDTCERCLDNEPIGRSRVERSQRLQAFVEWLCRHARRDYDGDRLVHAELSACETASRRPEVVDIDPQVFGFDAEDFPY